MEPALHLLRDGDKSYGYAPSASKSCGIIKAAGGGGGSLSPDPLLSLFEEGLARVSSAGPPPKGFDYLLDMPLGSLTTDTMSKMERDAQKAREALAAARAASVEDVWIRELDALDRAITAYTESSLTH